MSEQEQARVGQLTDVTDVANEPEEHIDKALLFGDVQLRLDGKYQMLALLVGTIGLLMNLMYYGFFPALIWFAVTLFVLDMMGAFEFWDEWVRDAKKPKGGYDNIG